MLRWAFLPECEAPPNDWEVRSFTDIATVIAGQSPPSDTYNAKGDGLPFLQGNADFFSVSPIPRLWCSAPAKTAAKGDILFSVRAPVGEMNLADQTYAIGRGLGAIRAKACDSAFLHCALQRWRWSLQRVAQGTTFDAVTARHFAQLSVCVPRQPDEQAAIARILDAVDTALERTRAAVDSASSLRDALIQALLDRGIGEDGRVRCSKSPPEGFVATQIGLLPREWRVEPLSTVADIERGRFSPRPRNDPRYYTGRYPFIQTGQVAQAKGRVITTFNQTLNGAGKAVSREFPTGTVMVTIAANIGETAILGLPMCAPDSLVGIMAKGDNVPRYLELCLRRLRRKLLALAPRSAQANINLTFLKPLRIPVPTPREQGRIASLVDAADARVQAIETRLEALRTLKQSLMHDLLTGRVRVTDEIKAAAS